MNLMDKLDEYESNFPQAKKEMCRIVPHNNPAFNRSILLANIKDIDKMNKDQLLKFISNQYRNLLKKIFFNKDESKDYINAFLNPDFLDAFIQVTENILQSGGFLQSDQIVKINTICYDYIRIGRTDCITNKMMCLGSIINRTKLPQLLGLGLSTSIANLLLIARYSNINLEICVKRVNFIIINRQRELMSTMMIENILRILFDMNEYYMVFQYIMYDVIPEYDENNQNTMWVTEDVEEVNSRLSLAALNILENLSLEYIRKCVLNYAEGYNTLKKNSPIRFSMKRLSEDYARINSVVSDLDCIEGILVP